MIPISKLTCILHSCWFLILQRNEYKQQHRMVTLRLMNYSLPSSIAICSLFNISFCISSPRQKQRGRFGDFIYLHLMNTCCRNQTEKAQRVDHLLYLLFCSQTALEVSGELYIGVLQSAIVSPSLLLDSSNSQ